jgi:hypothetical protein
MPTEESDASSPGLKEMDSQYTPIRIALNDTIVLNYVHYGESSLIRQLRWLPFVELDWPFVFTVHRIQLHQEERTKQYLGGNVGETAHA